MIFHCLAPFPMELVQPYDQIVFHWRVLDGYMTEWDWIIVFLFLLDTSLNERVPDECKIRLPCSTSTSTH